MLIPPPQNPMHVSKEDSLMITSWTESVETAPPSQQVIKSSGSLVRASQDLNVHFSSVRDVSVDGFFEEKEIAPPYPFVLQENEHEIKVLFPVSFCFPGLVIFVQSVCLFVIVQLDSYTSFIREERENG